MKGIVPYRTSGDGSKGQKGRPLVDVSERSLVGNSVKGQGQNLDAELSQKASRIICCCPDMGTVSCQCLLLRTSAERLSDLFQNAKQTVC